MRAFINYIVSTLKGEKFSIDHRIPYSYMIRFFFIKAISSIYGSLRFLTLKRIFIHPYSRIKCSSKISFGKNFSVAEGVYIDALSQNGFICGDNVSIGYNTHVELTGSLKYIGKGIKIGSNVGLGTHGHYGSGIGGLEIGNDVIIGNYVSFHPESHNFSGTSKIREQGVSGKGIKIGDNCWIGAKATFLDGSSIGDGCVVAAGAVVTKSFPKNSVIGGVPAKVMKKRV